MRAWSCNVSDSDPFILPDPDPYHDMDPACKNQIKSWGGSLVLNLNFFFNYVSFKKNNLLCSLSFQEIKSDSREKFKGENYEILTYKLRNFFKSSH